METDSRKAHYMNTKMHHPAVQWSLILGLVGLFFGGLSTGNELENQVNHNSTQIAHEKELRLTEEIHINRKLEVLTDDTKEIKTLLQNYIIQQNNRD